MTKEYTIYNRYDGESKELTEAEAIAITKAADLHTGPYGGMGSQIDMTLCRYDEANDTYVIEAVHHRGEWLAIPESQSAFMEHELGQNAQGE